MAGALLHVFILLTVCCNDTLSTLGNGYTSLPQRLDKYWMRAAACTTRLLGQNLNEWNPMRVVIGAYCNSAGIEAGYGYFGPNVPNSHKLVFELRHDNGEIDYELPSVSHGAAGQRLASLLDQIGSISYEPLRKLMLEMLTSSVFRRHSDVKSIRAVFGYVEVPTPEEMEHGGKDSYHFLYAYDFTISSPGGETR